MLKKLISLCFFGVLAFSNGPASASSAYREFRVGDWSVGAYRDNRTRQFSNCMATGQYRSGISLFVFVSRSLDWLLAFSHPDWRLSPGQKFPIQMNFDQRAPLHLQAEAISSNLVGVPMPATGPVVEAFRQSYVLRAFALGNRFEFNLTGTSRLLVEMVHCVRTELAIERGEPPPVLAQPAPARPPAQTPIPARRESSVSPHSTEMQLLATRIASNLLLQAQLPNARLLAPSEVPSEFREVAADGVAFVSDAGLGLVRLIRSSDGNSSQMVASNLIASDATACKGEFASARSTSLVDNDVVTRASVACRQSETGFSTNYYIVERRGFGFVVVGVLNADRDGAPGGARPGIGEAALQLAVSKAAATP